MTDKKSTFRTMAEAFIFEKLNSLNTPLNHLDKRKLSVDELKVVIREAFKDAKDVASVDAQELAHGWGDAEIENEIICVKSLNLKEFFKHDEEVDEKEKEEKEEKIEDKEEE